MVTDARAALSIGKLARQAGCNLETVRYYERIGLMAKPPRSLGGHRLYAEDATRRLTFIRRARELGFAIEDIRAMLGLIDRRAVTCDEVLAIARHQLEAVREKIADLRKLERVLATMTASCAGGQVPQCPIVDALYKGPRR
jgi:MerR family mercuric resistance operon transcriptional regulator